MKDLCLPSKVYEELAKVAEELSLMAKKPISQSMAVDLLIEVYHAHLNNRCALDMFSQQLQRADVMPPEEFDEYWDETIETQGSKPKTKARKTNANSHR